LRNYKKIREKWTVTKRLYDRLLTGGHRSIEEEERIKMGTFYGIEANLIFLTKELIESFLDYQISELKLEKEEAEKLRISYYQEYKVEDAICFILEISNQSYKGLLSLKKLSNNIVLIDNLGGEYRPLQYDPIFDEEFAGDISGKIFFPKVINKNTKWIKVILSNLYSEKEAGIYFRENFLEFPYRIPKDISLIIYDSLENKKDVKEEKKEKSQEVKSEIEEILKEGVNLYKKGELDSAIKKFQEVLEIHKDNIVALNMLGLAYLKKGLIDAAIYTFSRAIQIDPFLELTYYNQGLAYYEKKDIERAITSFSQAIVLNNKYVDAHYYLGLCYEEIKDYEKALKEYEEVLKFRPEDEKVKQAILRLKKD
jgi:tetratricopeptide (TPR) repeat protein